MNIKVLENNLTTQVTHLNKHRDLISHLISFCCNNVVIKIKSTFRPNDLARISIVATDRSNRPTLVAIQSVFPLIRQTWLQIQSNCLTSQRTRITIGAIWPLIAPVVGTIQRLRAKGAGVADQVNATVAH